MLKPVKLDFPALSLALTAKMLGVRPGRAKEIEALVEEISSHPHNAKRTRSTNGMRFRSGDGHLKNATIAADKRTRTSARKAS